MALRDARADLSRIAMSTKQAGRFPAEAVDYAHRTTLAAMSKAHSGRWHRQRVESYFLAVLRRRVLRRHPSSTGAARVVADSVVADLVASGRSRADAYEELRRGWTNAVPVDLLEEYRQLLCA